MFTSSAILFVVGFASFLFGVVRLHFCNTSQKSDVIFIVLGIAVGLFSFILALADIATIGR